MIKSVSIIGTRGYPSYYGGFETAVRRLAPYLADQGWQVRVYSRHGQVKLDDKTHHPRVESVMTWGLDNRSLSTLSYGLTACLHAWRHPTDVALVMNCANGFWLPLLRLRGTRVVVNVDGIEWERAKWGRFARWVFKTGARLTAHFATRLIFDAKAIAAYWGREFGRTGTYIPYGGDPRAGGHLHEEFGGRPYVLLVARFVPENSIRAFFEAVPRIAVSADVVLVGSDEGSEFNEAAQNMVDSIKGVHWLKHVSNDDRLHSLWQHCSVYFHGHSVGGTNPALVQAMALGANVVARDTVYNREVLGTVGRYCEAEASQILAAVEEALADPKDSNLVMNRARAQFSWEAVCRDYVQVLEDEVVTNRRSRAARNARERHVPRQGSL